MNKENELAERIGLLADKADNFAAATKLRLPNSIHIKALSSGRAQIRDELRKIHIEMTGNNPWE